MKDRLKGYSRQRQDQFRAPTTEQRIADLSFMAKTAAEVEHIPRDNSAPIIVFKNGQMEMRLRDTPEAEAPEIIDQISELGALSPDVQEWIDFGSSSPTAKIVAKRGPGRHKKA